MYTNIEFRSLDLPIKVFAGTIGPASYKVYSDKSNFVEVEAHTATDALEKSEVKNPFKVIKNGFLHRNIVNSDDLATIDDGNEESVSEEMTEEASSPGDSVEDNGEPPNIEADATAAEVTDAEENPETPPEGE